MRCHQKLNIREMAFQPETYLPLPLRVQVRINLVDQYNTAWRDVQPPVFVTLRQAERAECLDHVAHNIDE